MAVKVTIDRDKCVGAGVCVGLCPDVFELDDEDKAVAINPENVPVDDLKDAADRCPTQAITVEEA